MSRTALVILVVILSVLVLSPCPHAYGADLKVKAFQMREDYGTEPLEECMLQYYYYVPCPTYAWFWAFTGLIDQDILGVFYEVGDLSMGGYSICDPAQCHSLNTIRVIDFSGYGTLYPGLFTIEFDAYCSDGLGCPVGPSMWTTGSWELHFGWNYVPVEPPLCLTDCCAYPEPPSSSPRILITATSTGTNGGYPAWGFDNISTGLEVGCEMHDIGCLPALYPRPHYSHYPTIHTGYYGTGFQYCPPLWFLDGRDTTWDEGTQYGFIEAAWRIYVSCTGPTTTESVSWGGIKSMYR